MKVDQFLCGVIEGYYGPPWSFNQRITLFENCLKNGLNTYMYAPKDDDKHRSRWRDFYDEQEAKQLSQLIHLAKQNGIRFIYALSPGLDIHYSSEEDFNALYNKFNQLCKLGCEHWAILFDDIENEMCKEDQDRFASFAHAQVHVSNRLFECLNQPKIFLFCPTEYCARMATPNIEKSEYLQTIGNGLHEDIGILWTGPKVVSRSIPLSHLLRINRVLKRRVTIWENLNANDYDQRRLCLGPFLGRSTDISSQICGMLTNPNCEFQLNFIPFHTLGQWFQSISTSTNNYDVEKAFDQALRDWLPEFNRIQSANDSQEITKVIENRSIDSQLTVDDLRLLVELFYLPYQNGRNVQQAYANFYWLRFHWNNQQNEDEWRHRAVIFDNFAKTVANLLKKLLSIHNRALLYEIYFYILDMNSTVDLCSKYLHWINQKDKRSPVFMSGDVEPWCTRGGLAGQFLNILPLGDFQSVIQNDFNASSKIYFIRSINSNDRSSMYELTTKILYEDDFDDLLNQYPDILADKFLGGYFSSKKFDHCFGIDDNEDRLCGFVLIVEEIDEYDQIYEKEYLPELQRKYPNADPDFFVLNRCPQWISKQYSTRIQLFVDLTLTTENLFHLGMKLLKIIVDPLEKRGCRGCHAIIDERNSLLHQFYLRLGFVDLLTIDENIILGKEF